MKRVIGRGALLVSTLAVVLGSIAASAAEEPAVPATAPTQSQPPVFLPPVPTQLLAAASEEACAPPADPNMSACFGDLSDPNNPYAPGTPRGEARNQGDIGTATTADTIAEVARSKQWIRVPWVRVLAQAYNVSRRATPDETVKAGWVGLEANAYVISPAGSTNAYGDFPPTKVHSVAFGSVPVSYTVRVSQARDENDLPIPLHAISLTGLADPARGHPGGGNLYMNGPLTGKVEVRVTDLKVDGVAVPLGGTCRTQSPVDIALEGKGYWGKDPALANVKLPAEPNGFEGPGEIPPSWTLTEPWKETEYYHGPAGGLLTGSIAVPAFTGCEAGDEDLSGLVTSLASSPENAMKTRQGPTYQDGCFAIPDTPANQANFWWVFQNIVPCQESVPFPYPTGGND